MIDLRKATVWKPCKKQHKLSDKEVALHRIDEKYRQCLKCGMWVKS
jgi:hypothetical protein